LDRRILGGGGFLLEERGGGHGEGQMAGAPWRRGTWTSGHIWTMVWGVGNDGSQHCLWWLYLCDDVSSQSFTNMFKTENRQTSKSR
jgi:hypothetical protein